CHDNLAVGAQFHHFVSAGLRDACADRLSGGRVPKSHETLAIRLLGIRDSDLALRAPLEDTVRGRNVQNLPERRSEIGIPHPGGAVEAAREEHRAVGAVRHGRYPTLMLEEAE